ncbi:hypothetical protein OKHIL_68700 [Mycolicibacterium mageritense]
MFTQPGCGGCIFAAADLRSSGIQFAERDVRTDPDAAKTVWRLYHEHREPGTTPQTPVIVLDGQPFFGAVELHAYLRELRQRTAA